MVDKLDVRPWLGWVDSVEVTGSFRHSLEAEVLRESLREWLESRGWAADRELVACGLRMLSRRGAVRRRRRIGGGVRDAVYYGIRFKGKSAR